MNPGLDWLLGKRKRERKKERRDANDKTSALGTLEQKKKAEEAALRASEEKYKTMIQESTDAMIMINSTGRLLFANKATDTLTGRSNINDIGNDVLKLGVINRKEIPRLRNYIKAILVGRRISPFEISMVRADNTDIFVEIQGIKIRYQGEDAILVTLRDTTEQKKLVEALQRSEEKYRVLVENATDQIFMLDKESRFLSLNKKAAALSRKSADEMIGKSILEMFPKETAVRFSKNIDEVFKTGKSKSIDEKMSVSGKEFYNSTILNPIKNDKKKVVAVMGVVRDITERKKAENTLHESEERFKSIFDNANEGMILADVESKKFHTGNKAICRMLGYDEKEIKNLGVGDIHPKKDLPYVLDQFKKQAEGKLDIARDLPVKRKDGSIFYADVNSGVITLNGKKYLTGFFTDITERKNEEERAKGYATKLEAEVTVRTKQYHDESDRVETLSVVKDEFIQNVSHELKTPLSVILVNLLLLRDIAPVDKQQEWMKILDMLDRNSTRLNGSINQILQLSKLNSSELKREKVYIQDLIAEVYKEHLPLAKMKNLEFKTQTEPAIIIGDCSLLQLAINNLVSNAIKFTDKDSVIIKSTAYDKGVSISVIDTGIGISPENKNKLFEKFFKVNPNATGTGIGLTIVKQIIEKHGGSIDIKSKLGKGSTFEVILPRGTEKID